MIDTCAAGLRALPLGLILAALLAPASWATAPGRMSYQGRLKQTGFPVNGSRSVAILLCPDPAGPSANCLDTGAQGVLVTNGLFRTTFTVPADANLATGSWYLEIQVDGAPFTPREALSAGPYAIYASSAATLVANPGAAAVIIATNVVVGGVLTLGATGHIVFAGALPPSAADGCGGGTVAGGDGAGRITLGAAPDPTCKLNFGAAWGSNAPVCHFNNETRVQPLFVSAVDVLSVTFTAGATALNAGDVISYMCLGY